MAYRKIYKITVKADDEKQLPTEDEIKLLLNEIPSDYEYHIDVEEARNCEDCMCADVENGRIYCHLNHRFRKRWHHILIQRDFWLRPEERMYLQISLKQQAGGLQ